MSIEIDLRTDTGTREGLTQLLTSQGLEIIHPRFPPPEVHHEYIRWFETDGYKSFDGVEASIMPRIEGDIPAQAGWFLHTRTRVSASPFDREKQNEIIRLAQEQFGGIFENDWFGENEFTPVNPDDHSPVERGIALVAAWAKEQLNKVIMSVPGPMFGKDNQDEAIREILRYMDPTTVLYNALVPFAVAALEYFFGQTFKVLMTHDASCRGKMTKETRKVEMADAVAIASGTKTIEDVVASWYTFQNFDAIHKAYNDWFGIDFWRAIRSEMARGSKVQVLSDVLNEIVERRHGVIHHFEFDLELDKEAVREIFDAIEHTIVVFIDTLERDKGLRIKDVLPL